ncbi:MAG TPA: glycosyltransferase family 4 protein [Hyphomonadaceae bacterium]|nr:glycosyltransferase family 4 protein [Hyphomonadaceae bacterium]
MIGNFPPRKCGIATFTRDTFSALRDQLPKAHWSLVAMDDRKADYDFPPEVTHTISQDDPAAYVAIADQLNQSGAEVAFVQHEFGIFGGEAGAHLLLLLRRLKMPVIVTLHTVLEKPNASQKRVMDEIIERASAIIVMSETGADILARVHNAGPSKVFVIPHGAPERPFASPEAFKPALGLAGHKVFMTFGLLSPNKGLETVVRAMPDIIARHPDAIYLVVGATHPHLIANEGEKYRDSLVALAESLGVAANLRFVNRFVGDDELVNLLQAADLYVTPYLTEAQITSGTLSYAIALGKPVISTPYWHAREALADGVGALVPFGDSNGFAREITSLLSDQIRREQLARRAYRYGEPSRWRKVAGSAIELAQSCRTDYRIRQDKAFRTLSRPSLDALRRITDDCGVIQHSAYSVPDRRHGYCTDDNARLLSLMARTPSLTPAPGPATAPHDTAARLTYTAAAFVAHAWNPDNGRFRNFMGFNRQWLDDGGSDDCCARAFEALCLTARHSDRPDLRDWAATLAARVFVHAAEWSSIRSRALVIKALAAPGGPIPEDKANALVRINALKLMDCLAEGRKGGHDWFEICMSYDNARLPEALILAGKHLNDAAILNAGIDTLDFVMRKQTSKNGWFCPVPTSTFAVTDATRASFDQQPIEALATVDACLAAYEATNDPRRSRQAREAFMWFGGQNDHGLALASPVDGGCFDALVANGVNQNQGAESILSYQLAAAAIRERLRQLPSPD